MAVSPTKNPPFGSSPMAGMIELNKRGADDSNILDQLPKRAKDCPSSMESDFVAARLHEHCRVLPFGCCEGLSPASSTFQSECEARRLGGNEIPRSVDVVAYNESSLECSPLQSQGPTQNASMTKPPQHLYHRSSSKRLGQASVFFGIDCGSLLVPPTLISEESSKCYLLGQPMIKSPAPRVFLPANPPPGSTLRRYFSAMTPLNENTFHPTMFSVDTDVSGQTPYSGDAGTGFAPSDYPLRSTPSDRREPVGIHETGTVAFSSTPKRRVGADTVGPNHRESKTSVDSLHSARTPPTKSNRDPFMLAHDKMIAFVASMEDLKNPIIDNDIKAAVCTCPKSKCLKLYCVCFQRAALCDKILCKCTDCKNTKKHSGPNGALTLARENISRRRPDAFGVREKQVGLGCSCKRNKCLKKYCACFAEGTPCDEKCGCANCHNQPRPSEWFSGMNSPLSMGSEICPV